MDLIEIIAPHAVKFHHGTGSKKRLIQDLSLLASQSYDISADDAFAALLERESLGPTGVGRGVALPHARLPGLDRVVGVFIRLDQPVDFEAVDRQPVDLAFALFAPTDGGIAHLKALAAVSRTLRDSDVCRKLRNNDEHNLLHTILIEGPAMQAA